MPRLPLFRLDKPPTRGRWEKALGKTLIFTRDAVLKYAPRFGRPFTRWMVAVWLRKGHLRRAGGSTPGKSSVLYEADIAYCAEVHAWRQAVGIPKTVPLLDDDGEPGLPAHKSSSEVNAEYRARKAKGIRLRAPRRKGTSPPSRPKKPALTARLQHSKKP